MIDIRDIKYKLILITENGVQIDITGATEDLGFGEGKSELSMRTTFSICNAKYNGQYLFSLAKPGCIIAVIAEYGTKPKEVARGHIIDWDNSNSSSADRLDILAYDELFYLQQSQDSRYISDGTGTKTAITSIFNDWGVPIAAYKGPDIRHAKTLFKNEYLSDIVIQLLDTAKKQGAGKFIVRAHKGAVSVIPEGSNSTIYHFDEDSNLEVTRDRISTQSLVTRVKVVATTSNDTRPPVEAVLDGQTKFGIRQRIYNRSEDDTLATAKSAAQDILNEHGSSERTMRFQGPDVPSIRKGDKIHIKTKSANGYFIVKSIQHNTVSRSMSMDVSPEETPKVITTINSPSTPIQSEFNKGDKVILNGAVYRDSYGTGKGRTFKNHVGTITIKVNTSRACPYHVDWIGWVYPNTITKA